METQSFLEATNGPNRYYSCSIYKKWDCFRPMVHRDKKWKWSASCLPAKFCYSTLSDREGTNFNAQWFIYLFISLSAHMQKFEHFGAKIKNRPKSSLRTFLHGALHIVLSVHAIQRRMYMLKRVQIRLKSFVGHSPGIGYPSSCFDPDKRHLQPKPKSIYKLKMKP